MSSTSNIKPFVFSAVLGSCLAISSVASAGGDGRFLVIFDGTFRDQVEDYRDWKIANDPGLDAIDLIDVAATGAAPIDAADIDGFITAHATLHPDLKYVLLVGDETTVPPKYEIDATKPEKTIPSDHDYANLDADDDPELAIGRIVPFGSSVVLSQRKANLANQFAKIQTQHQVMPSDPLYDKMLMALPFLDDVVAATATVGAVVYAADGTTTAGAAGNAYKIKYVLAANGLLHITTSATAESITVHLGTYPGGGSSSTANAVANAINSHAVASTWVSAVPVPGLEMTAQPAIGWVQLAGGADADGIPNTSILESGESAVLHLEDMNKTVVRAYRATSVDETGAIEPGGVAPEYADSDGTVTIAAFSPAIEYNANGFDWSADATDIADALDDGVRTVVYMGHGNPSSWATPHFDIDDAGALDNTVHPVVFNFACSTGNYVGNDSLAEALMQNPYGGASAMFSASSPVIGAAGLGLGDYMDGLLDSVDDDHDARMSHAGEDLHRIGDRLVYMKRFIVANFTGGNVHDHVHQFTLFGDPTMRYNPFK
jgi:hypothetical protein